MQALYRRATATRADDARARLERDAPSAQAAVAQAAARRVMQALANFLGFACLLVGVTSLVPGGLAPPRLPPPPPPPAQWRAAGLGRPEPFRGAHAVKTPKATKTPKTPKAPSRRRPPAHPKASRQGGPKAGSANSSPRPPHDAVGPAKPPRARKRGESAMSAV